MKQQLKQIPIIGVLFLAACVSTKKFNAMQQQDKNRYDSLYTSSQRQLTSCEDANSRLTAQNSALQGQVNDLSGQLSGFKENNTQLLKQLQDLSVISSSQAESIKKSLDNIGAKDTYIRDLQAALAQRDSLNLAHVMNLKGVLGNINDSDVNIKVEKSVIYIDISDKMLFNTAQPVLQAAGA